MKPIYFSILIFSVFIKGKAQNTNYGEQIIYKTKFDDVIPVLNVATFHMGETSDANKTDFDEHDQNN